MASEMMSRAIPEAEAIVLSTMPMGDGSPLLRFVHSASTELTKALSEVAQWTAANTEESNGTSVAFALGSGGLCVVDSRDFGRKGVRTFADWAAATRNTALKRHFAVTCLLNVRLALTCTPARPHWTQSLCLVGHCSTLPSCVLSAPPFGRNPCPTYTDGGRPGGFCDVLYQPLYAELRSGGAPPSTLPAPRPPLALESSGTTLT